MTMQSKLFVKHPMTGCTLFRVFYSVYLLLPGAEVELKIFVTEEKM